MMRSLHNDVLISIRNEEQKAGMRYIHIIEESFQMTVFLKDLLGKVRKKVLKEGFKNETDEIFFFKKVKPNILGKLIYYNKIYRIETACPVNNGKIYLKYFNRELEDLKLKFKRQICSSDFYQYYRSGRTDRDCDYFILGNLKIHNGLNSFAFDIDPEFSTFYDYKVAQIIANELLHDYLLAKTETDIHSNFPGKLEELEWTESKNALIELIYALHVSGALSNGKGGIRKITRAFESFLNIQLGDLHHAFHRMKQRVGSRTMYLDKLKISLDNYMDKDL